MADDIIVWEQLSFQYPRAQEFALREINLRVRRGEFLAVMGPTGAGKTTLCLTLNGIVPQFYGGDFYGAVRVLGMDTTEHPTYKLAHHVGMVFQDPEVQLTAPTVAREIAFVLENVRLPADEIRRRIPAALQAVRLEGLEEKHPHQLSGGQKQRLAIAAALALQPDILVLDEPTSQLDPVGTAEVLSLVRQLNREQGMTIVLVSHASEEVAEYADRVALLAEGSLVLVDEPHRFFQNVDLLYRYDVRPPGVTEAFQAVFQDSTLLPAKPVTLPDALQLYTQLQTHLLVRPVVYPKGSERSDQREPILQTHNLHYVYEDGTPALRGVSLQIRQGEYVALVGQNGAGKSTLVRHFLNLLQATKGSVTLFGQPAQRYQVSDLAQRIGYISQNPDNQIFSDTVEGEVAFALVNLRFPKAEIATRVEAALDEMRLTWAAKRHPLTLSKGDRSRVVIAAILAMRPDVLVFDEPTTGQDYGGARAILDLTREMHESGRTIVIITHHLYLLPGYAERLVVMGQGQILLDAGLREVLYATAALQETYLAPPQIVQLAQAIQPPVGPPLRPLTGADMAEALVVREGAA